MTYEVMLDEARKTYARPAQPSPAPGSEPLPQPPAGTRSPEEFVDCLLEAAFRRCAKLRHPFAVRLGRGEWDRGHLQTWVRQDYQRTVHLIRRHALLAANADDYDTVWGLLHRVKVEADVDPVGGVFFALPQLWIKFGIALGLSRVEVTDTRPHPLIGMLNDAMLAEVRFSAAVPVRDFVDAALDPLFHQLWGEALEKSLGLPHDPLDFFWAIAADRWGGETGRRLLLGWAGSPEAQRELWNRYWSEVADDREWCRFTILQRIVESKDR